MNRTLNVVRLQLINRQTFIWIPLIILGGAFALTLLVYALIRGAGGGGGVSMYGGGAQAPLWYFFAVGIQALTFTFPFSQAMSITRREFFLGTMLTAALTSAILSVISVVGGLIEQATNGWGMNGWFFAWSLGAGPFVGLLINFVIAMFAFVIGFWGATIYKRFGGLWLTVVLVGVGLLLVGAMWVIGALNAWEAVGAWVATAGPVVLALCGAAVTVVLGAISFLTLRRAVP